jgi:hypothetical protein
MPRGAKPKVYDPALVDEVRKLYASGYTQDEIADKLGTTQKVIWNLMRRHNLKARVAAKRDQRNHMWRGDEAKYAAMHLRVRALRGEPFPCSVCGTTKAKRYQWASLNKNYGDPYDYAAMCQSCHAQYDGVIRNITKAAM